MTAFTENSTAIYCSHSAVFVLAKLAFAVGEAAITATQAFILGVVAAFATLGIAATFIGRVVAVVAPLDDGCSWGGVFGAFGLKVRQWYIRIFVVVRCQKRVEQAKHRGVVEVHEVLTDECLGVSPAGASLRSDVGVRISPD